MGASISYPEVDAIVGTPAKREMAMGGAYDAGSRSSLEMAMWTPPMLSANREIMPDKGISDVRVRDMLRNDAYITNGMTIQKDSIVGEMFLLNAKPNLTVLGLDETWADEFQEEVEAKFTLYAESQSNFPDAQRQNTLTGLTRLAVGIGAMTGEVLATVEWLRDSGRPFNTAFQMVDIDRLCNPQYTMDNATTVGGIQRNIYGAPTGYWIRMAHPSQYDDPNAYQWKFVPLTKPWGRLQVLHIIGDQWRADQNRGISRMVTALKEMKMTKKFRDIVLQSAVLNATYAATIESELPTETIMASLGAGDTSAVTQYGAAYLGAIAQYTGGARNLHIDGIKIPHLYPGSKLKLQNAATPGGVGSTFEESMLRYIAASLDVSYEELAKDYSKTNYSGFKAALAGTERRMRVQKRFVADRFAGTFYRLWLEEALNKGEITSMPRNAPDWYQGQFADAYCQAEWIGANQGQIDELKETQAAVLRINNGLSTREMELGKLGKDWRMVYRQLAREKKAAEEAGLVFGGGDGQNAMNAAGGKPQDEGKKPDSAEGDKGDE